MVGEMRRVILSRWLRSSALMCWLGRVRRLTRWIVRMLWTPRLPFMTMTRRSRMSPRIGFGFLRVRAWLVCGLLMGALVIGRSGSRSGW